MNSICIEYDSPRHTIGTTNVNIGLAFLRSVASRAHFSTNAHGQQDEGCVRPLILMYPSATPPPDSGVTFSLVARVLHADP